MLRPVVAVLFVVSLVTGVVVTVRQDDGDGRAVAVATTTTTASSSTTTIAAPPPTEAETTTTAAPAPTTTAAPTPLPPPTAAPSGVAKALVSPQGIVVPVTGQDAAGFRVISPCGRPALVSGGTPIVDATVVLDPGHGGVEPGAIGPNGVPEKVINMAVVDHARTALEAAGVNTIRTRTGDYRVTLDTRARIAKAVDAKAFVSVHHNAEPDGPRAGPGTETYYQVASPDSKRLAGLIYEEVVKALSAYQVAWVADTDAGTKYRRSDNGDDYYGILRRSQGVTGALAELAFVSNAPEADLLARADVQKAEGEAVARGILRFLTTRDPGSGFVEPYPRTSPAGGGGGASNCVDPRL